MRISFRSIALLAVAIPGTAALSQSFPPGVTPVAGAVVNVSPPRSAFRRSRDL